MTDVPRSALVLGGNSDIGLAIVRRMARDGLQRVVLATRDVEALQKRVADGCVDGVAATVVPWDALDVEGHEAFVDGAAEQHGRFDLVVCAVGALGHHAGATMATGDAAAAIASNFTGPATAVLAAGRHLAAVGGGTIVVLSSMAGVRARRSNFVYGSAKAGLDAFCQGLTDALVPHHVRVVIVRPGFVHSKMTAGLQAAPLAATPGTVADAVAGAVASGRSAIVHVPSTFRWIFAVLGRLPQPVWRRLMGDR